MMETSVSIAESFAQAGFLRQADIQDAINQEQVDEVIIHDADDKMRAACGHAAAALAAAGLIEERDRNAVAAAIVDAWGVNEIS